MSAPRAMHPLCCIVLDRPGVAGDQSPDLPTNAAGGGGGPPRTNGEDVGVAGFLYKWTNYGRGWRSRWFSLRHGVLSYSKIRPQNGLPPPENGGIRLIGDASARISSREGGLREAPAKPVDVVYLKPYLSHGHGGFGFWCCSGGSTALLRPRTTEVKLCFVLLRHKLLVVVRGSMKQVVRIAGVSLLFMLVPENSWIWGTGARF
ncbi:hypothetical protein BHE74_00006897 [Ensete ventricosum]|nr:hypothetical protein BHE74_00006897 [Ensete ventricosum]